MSIIHGCLSENSSGPAWLHPRLKTQSALHKRLARRRTRFAAVLLAVGGVAMRRLGVPFIALPLVAVCSGPRVNAQPVGPTLATQRPPLSRAAPVSVGKPHASVGEAPSSRASSAFAPDDIVALVHADNPVERIKRADLAAMYLGQRKAWTHGPRVRVLRRTSGSAPRARVNQKVLKMSSAHYRRHWQRTELAGRGIAPRSVGSAAQLLRRVRSEREAVGCLTGAEAARLPRDAGVRAIRVEE